jgi:hypothetical protein
VYICNVNHESLTPKIIINTPYIIMNAQKIQNAQNNFQSNQSTQNGQFTKKTPRYKFDETWLNAISNYYAVCSGHDNSYNANSTGHSNNGNGHGNSYSADELKQLINGYLEGTNDCSELYDTYFGCAWIVIKAEIDRRKARNARARERRLQRRAEKLAAAQQASQENASTAHASLGAKATSEKAVATTISNDVAQSTDKIAYDEPRNNVRDNAMSVSEITPDENAASEIVAESNAATETMANGMADGATASEIVAESNAATETMANGMADRAMADGAMADRAMADGAMADGAMAADMVDDAMADGMADGAMADGGMAGAVQESGQRQGEATAAGRKVAKPRKAMPTDEKRMRSRCFQKSVQKIIFKKNHNSTNPRRRNANLHACCRK